ncbi:MAG: hypothetical protein JWP01_2981 [Myxococcales bacterium]|nr:hypothetical protein [Myxococcales bacterium]
MRLGLVAACALVSLTSAAVPARAEGDEDDGSALQVHAFVSQGAAVTTDNNYLTSTERGSFELTEAGINFSKALNDRLRVGIQLFTRDLGPIGNYTARVDWAFLDYRWKDWLGLRAGRVKLPFGLYNDSSDIDAAHPVVLLPQSIYPATNREALLAQTGAELYGFKPLGTRGALEYRLFAGTIHVDLDETTMTQIDRLEIPYVVGGRVMWETPVEGLRLGGSAIAARLESDLRLPTEVAPITLALGIRMWIASLEYVTGPITFATEYSRWTSRLETNDPRFPRRHTTDTRAYWLAAYRFSPLVQAAGYYSIYYPDLDNREGRESRLHDAAATLRFDLNPHWLLKIEGHALRGTATLNPALNDNMAPGGLANRWWLLVAKTTVYF